MKITANDLIRLPHDEMVRKINSWAETKALQSREWEFWQRGDQSVPVGDWRVWLVMAGRGYGKTRMGAEWVCGLAMANPGARIALVGATITEAGGVTARSTTPLAPVHASAKWVEDGSIAISWIRRSRIDAGWRDGIDQMLVEDAERYKVALLVDGVAVAEWLTNIGSLWISPAEYGVLPIAPGAEPVFAIRQIGRHAQSDPRYINIS
jgi:hypothetical protein